MENKVCIRSTPFNVLNLFGGEGGIIGDDPGEGFVISKMPGRSRAQYFFIFYAYECKHSTPQKIKKPRLVIGAFLNAERAGFLARESAKLFRVLPLKAESCGEPAIPVSQYDGLVRSYGTESRPEGTDKPLVSAL